MLKADFHIHTSEDRHEYIINYSAKDIIDIASKLGFKVLSITNHLDVYYSKELEKYAKEKGIILIPGIEALVEGKEVLVLGLEKCKGRMSFEELRRLRRKGALVIAPHPYYPKPSCLKDKLVQYIDLFDAIEFSHYYTGGFTNMFNRKADRIAKRYKKPLIGNSDAHRLYQFNKTYTFIDADFNKKDIINDVKNGKVKLSTKPLSYYTMFKHVIVMAINCFLRIYSIKSFKNK